MQSEIEKKLGISYIRRYTNRSSFVTIPQEVIKKCNMGVGQSIQIRRERKRIIIEKFDFKKIREII